MKDIQGYNRGKCNSCECLEYREPPADTDSSSGKPRRLRCEYCNHTPVEHVWLVELGECTKCGANNCDKYESEESNSYTDCGYCGCSPNDHKGAEKLRRNATPMAAVVPRVDASGSPVQSLQFGKCKRPDCVYPRRMDKGVVYDYCSRTCASLHQTAPYQSTSVSQSTQSQPWLSTSTTATGPTMTAAQGPGQPLIPTLCSSCKSKPSNQGHRWCSACYTAYEAQKNNIIIVQQHNITNTEFK